MVERFRICSNSLVHKKDSPGAVITSYAFKYACSFYDYAADKFPELTLYTPENSRGASLQAAIIVAALLLQERRLGAAARQERFDDVIRSFPPAVQHRHLAAIHSLSAELQPLGPGAADDKLVKAIGLWLARSVSRKKELTEPELKLAAAMGRSAWTSATMIARMLQPR